MSNNKWEPKGNRLSLPARLLRDGLRAVRPAMATEDGRPALFCIRLEPDGDDVVFVATDGFIMAVMRQAVTGPADELFDATEIHGDVVDKLIDDLHGLKGDSLVDLWLQSRWYNTGDAQRILPEPVGNFPDWREAEKQHEPQHPVAFVLNPEFVARAADCFHALSPNAGDVIFTVPATAHSIVEVTRERELRLKVVLMPMRLHGSP